MEEYFEIPVTYQGEEQAFTSRLLTSGYTHKIEVEVNGQLILFEPDEEWRYRAVTEQPPLNSAKIDVNLLKAIATVIEETRR